MTSVDRRPIVLITGATGNLGRSLADALGGDYRIVGLDRTTKNDAGFPVFEADFASDASVALALHKIRNAFGSQIASVIHLVAYFDFTGEANPLYQSVNVEGTRRILRALQAFDVKQFVYASTMLVHAPGNPGERIDEPAPQLHVLRLEPADRDPRVMVIKSPQRFLDHGILRAGHARDPCLGARLGDGVSMPAQDNIPPHGPRLPVMGDSNVVQLCGSQVALHGINAHVVSSHPNALHVDCAPSPIPQQTYVIRAESGKYSGSSRSSGSTILAVLARNF
jgi:hypothetical protein